MVPVDGEVTDDDGADSVTTTARPPPTCLPPPPPPPPPPRTSLSKSSQLPGVGGVGPRTIVGGKDVKGVDEPERVIHRSCQLQAQRLNSAMPSSLASRWRAGRQGLQQNLSRTLIVLAGCALRLRRASFPFHSWRFSSFVVVPHARRCLILWKKGAGRTSHGRRSCHFRHHRSTRTRSSTFPRRCRPPRLAGRRAGGSG